MGFQRRPARPQRCRRGKQSWSRESRENWSHEVSTDARLKPFRELAIATALTVVADRTVATAMARSLPARIPIFRLRLRSVEHDELVREDAVRIAPFAIRPLHSDFRSLGRAEADMDPTGVT